jgi:hypothetical protein
MKTTNSIKDLGITLEDLYNNDVEKSIQIALSDKPLKLQLVLTDLQNKPDCKISSWGMNIWARTNKGIICERYNTLQSLQSAIVRKIREVIESDGDISFELINERHFI